MPISKLFLGVVFNKITIKPINNKEQCMTDKKHPSLCTILAIVTFSFNFIKNFQPKKGSVGKKSFYCFPKWR